MTISQIGVRLLRIPVKEPTRISTRLLDNRDYVVVSLRRDGDDTEGTGYTYAGTTGGTVVVHAIRELLEPVLLGRDAEDIVGAWEAMYQASLLLGRRGAVLRAMSAVDIALWDLAAKRAHVPLAVLLGGGRTSVPAYASGGYYKPSAGSWTGAVAEEIEGNLALGFTDHKIKVGGLSYDEDAQRVAAAVDAMGGRGRLALDANNAYRSVAEATRALRAFERAAGPTGLWWFEEPLSPDDPAGHAELRRRSDTPIATGEIAASRHDFRDLLTMHSVDVLQPDAAVLGGVTEYMRVVRTAETFGVPVAPHWHANLHVHLAAASTNCLTVEHFDLGKDIYNFETVVAPESRLQVAGGRIEVPAGPGLGISWDESAMQKYSVPA
jgi:L-alanine-DL-glutamate epimerase-like enolase superfamily enzyme